MAYLGVNPAQRNARLIPAAFALVLMGLICVVDIRLFNQSWPLTWLPFTIVALWPRRVGALQTGLLLLVGGLWVDWTTWGAPGQWPLVFLLTYALIRPDINDAARGLGPGMKRFTLALLIGVPVLIATGWVVYESWPDWAVLGRGILMATLTAPIIILVRDGVAARMSQDD